MLEAVGDVVLGVDQQIAREPDNTLIRATTGCWRQLGCCGGGDVYADDGVVAIVEFPNVRATAAGGGLRSVLMRVWADAFDKSHAELLL